MFFIEIQFIVDFASASDHHTYHTNSKCLLCSAVVKSPPICVASFFYPIDTYLAAAEGPATTTAAAADGVVIYISYIYIFLLIYILVYIISGKSNSKMTRHINLRYFFIKRYLETGEFEIIHCPTSEQIADILTKPLQGSQFIYLRDLLLG